MKIDQISIKEIDYNSTCWKCRKYKHACAKSDSITQSLGTRDQNIAVPHVRWDRQFFSLEMDAQREILCAHCENFSYDWRTVRVWLKLHLFDVRRFCITPTIIPFNFIFNLLCFFFFTKLYESRTSNLPGILWDDLCIRILIQATSMCWVAREHQKNMSYVLHDFWILGTIFYTEKFNFLICTDSNFLSHWFQQQRIVSLINKEIGTYFANLVVVESICSTRMLNSARTYIASPKRSSISPGGPSHSFASRRTWRSPPVSHAL